MKYSYRYRSDCASSLVEYCLLVAALSVAVLASASFFGNAASDNLEQVALQIDTYDGGSISTMRPGDSSGTWWDPLW